LSDEIFDAEATSEPDLRQGRSVAMAHSALKQDVIPPYIVKEAQSRIY